MPESDFKTAFINAMRQGGEARMKAFNYFAVQQGEKFKGETGWQFYKDLLEIVRESGSEEAVKQFQDRFVPLLDQEKLKNELFEVYSGAIDKLAEQARASAPTTSDPEQFLAMARAIYQKQNRAAFDQWLGITLGSVSETDRIAILSTLLRMRFESEQPK